MKKIDVVKLANIAGVALSLAGTVISTWAQTKDTKGTIANLVDEALKNKK